MRVAASLALCLSLTLALQAAEPKTGLGTWKLLGVVADGQEVPIAPATVMEVTAEGWTVTVGGQFYEKGTSKATGGDKSLAESEYTPSEGPRAGKKYLQITKVEGDILISCAADSDKPRPTEFTSKPGSGHILSVWRRIK